MEIYHKNQVIDGIEQIVIYANYPSEYEFGLDFDSIRKKVAEVSDKIREYALKNIGKVSDNTVLLILNGIVVGTLLVSKIGAPGLTPELPTTSEIVQNVDLQEVQNLFAKKDDKNNDTAKENVNTDVNIEQGKLEEINKSQSSTAQPANKPAQNANTSNTVKPPSKPPPSNNNSNSNNSVTNPPVNQGRIINLKLSSGKIIQISLEDYVIGVVGSEMPAEFSVEAMKAQAIAARTYALKRIANGSTLTATTADQVYKTNNELKQMWGNSYNTYYNKVKGAVNATEGLCALYNGQYIDALYYSTSNGKTEDAKNVWGYSYPYLVSVDSSWDLGVRGFEQTKTISMDTISQKLSVKLTSISQITINSKTVSGRVSSITICGKTYTGVQIRTLLGLRSADFTVSLSGNSIVFTTKGYGHGVGMSQYGANGMSKQGYSFTQILKHYYPGITIVKK